VSNTALNEYGNGVVAFANGLRAMGMPVPTVSEIVRDHLAAHPDQALDQQELAFLLKYAGGDLTEILEAVPAESVPAEISGAWYEVRASLPLVRQLGEFLKDPDDQADVDSALRDLLVALA